MNSYPLKAVMLALAANFILAFSSCRPPPSGTTPSSPQPSPAAPQASQPAPPPQASQPAQPPVQPAPSGTVPSTENSTPPQVSANGPTVPDNAVFRPTFDTTLGSVDAGTAFAVQLEGRTQPAVLSALHLLGSAGGLDEQVSAADVGKVMKNVKLVDCFKEGTPIEIGNSAIVIADAALVGKPAKAGDVIAFLSPEGSGVHAFRLAESFPKPGERVWLAAQIFEGAPIDQRLHPATVTGKFPTGECQYRFDNQIKVTATSGAPVLNAAGEVVAINLAALNVEGKIHGVGNPVEVFRPAIMAALASSSAP